MQDSDEFDLYEQSIDPDLFNAPKLLEEKQPPPVPPFKNFEPEAAAEE